MSALGSGNVLDDDLTGRLIESADQGWRCRVSLQGAYQGEFYSFGGLTVDPCAVQPHMPIGVGGRTRRSLRRAVTLADGWCPYYVSIHTAAEWLAQFELPADFEVVMPAEQSLDPAGKPEATQDTLREMADGGTTTLSARFVHHSLQHYLEQLHALIELHRETFGADARTQ